MHRHGGMYADLDMEALRDLTPLLDGATGPVLAALSANWTLRHNIPNAWMASPPGHPFWQVRTECVQSPCRHALRCVLDERDLRLSVVSPQRAVKHGSTITFTAYRLLRPCAKMSTWVGFAPYASEPQHVLRC